jgi:hypothetical protein
MLRTAVARGTSAAIVLAVVWTGVGVNSTSAHVPHPGLNFWTAVDRLLDCNTRSRDATCDITAGSTFIIDVYLDPVPSDIAGYGGFDISIQHSGLTPVPNSASTDAWPDCAFPASAFDQQPHTDLVQLACAIGVPPAGASTYSGLIGTVSFTCVQAGSISMIHGVSKTDLVEWPDIRQIHAEDPNTTERLNIACGTALARFADANCDGVVNSVDALLILQFSAHLFDHLPCPEAADANGDGVVNSVDAALVLQAVAGLLGMPTPPPGTATMTPTVTPTSSHVPTPTARPTP